MSAEGAPRPFAPVSRTRGGEIHLAALEELAPPTIVVDERWNVLHLSPTVARFLQQGGGPLAQRITDLVRPELRDELHALLHRTAEGAAALTSVFVPVRFNGTPHRVAIVAQRRAAKPGKESYVLITFIDGGEAGEEPIAEQEPNNEVVRSLREQLRQAEQRVETMRDDSYLANQELRSANEELQSLNEEYRSTAEELETSKEELQSINEELHTVNNELKVRLEEISHTNTDLENLMTATDVATLFLDAECRIGRFTPQLADIFNIIPRDRERPIGDLTHKLDYVNLESDARKILVNGEKLEREVRDTTGNVYLARLRPYRQGAGEISGVVITFIDMTPIKRAEAALRESQQQLAEELNVMRVLHGIAIEITTGATLYSALDEFLGAALKLMGAEFGTLQLLADDAPALKIVASRGLGPEYLKAFETVEMSDDSSSARAMRTRKTWLIEDATQDRDLARHRDLIARAGFNAVQAEPLVTKDGEFVGVLSLHFRAPRKFSDHDRQLGGLLALQAADFISGRIKQDRLRRGNESLQQRTLELEAARVQLSGHADDLDAQDQDREQFLAALGHELRNPMAAIRSSIEVITPSDDKSVRAVKILERQVAQMNRLINDILDVTRIHRGSMRLNLRRFDLKECVAAAVESARGQAQAKGLDLASDFPQGPIVVECDPERIGQILDNLLRNALNFTARGSITVSVQRSGNEAVVTVRDTGAGVEANRLASLFDGSRRSASSTGDGLGMGLSLVKELVELHHGRVTFRSEGRGLGSEVTFTIPLMSSEVARSEATDNHKLLSKRILVIDDNSDAADALAILLENMGHQVIVAYSGTSALEAARRQNPQVAFVDLTMPEMSGAEVARGLRQLFTPAELTLVALSGHSRSHPSAQEPSFDYHLLKPAGREDIVTILQSL